VSESAVLVLLSSYNGARYIAEQIESIRAQTVHDWRLLVRDDGSTDETKSIVRRFSSLDDRIEMLGDNRGNVGPWASFGLLLSAAAKAGARYLFLSDQDDVWIPTKMAGQLEALRRTERSHGTSRPILTHSDLEVVGDKLEPIHPSYRQFQNLSHDVDDPLRTLLIHNGMVGCTIAMNRALLDFALPLPLGSAHDWWLGLCAAATGTIVTSAERTVRYRQHASNVIGAHPRRALISRAVRHPLGFIAESLAAFDVGVRQSVELSERLAQRTLGSPETQRRVRQYSQAFSPQPLPSRVRSLRESGARPRRPLSRLLLLGIVSILPLWKARHPE
jgi:glycosyltransferase involved in cell wall biosynthesis